MSNMSIDQEIRCRNCGLVLPCHCKADKQDFYGVGPHEQVVDEPIVIIHRRPRRHSYPLPGLPIQPSRNLLDIPSTANENVNAASSILITKPKTKPLHYLRDLFSANPDNKLALKLFGNKAAVLLEQQRQTTRTIGVIHPFSTFRWYWDILLVVFIFMHILLLPVNIAFLSDDLSMHWMVINGMSDLFFVFDIILNFRTGLVDPNNKDEVILDSAIIRRSYLRGWFIIDLVSSLPFDYIYSIVSSTTKEQTLIKASRALKFLKLAKVLSLLRLLRVSRLVRYIKRFEELLNIASGQLRIVKLICCMMLLCHWNGCVQFLVPYLQGFPDNSWVVINGLVDKAPMVQYSWSLFNAMSHMLCIGYGRYPPRSTTELWLTILSMTIGATFYAVFIGIMSSLVMTIDSSGRLYNEKLNQVEEYMRYRKLPLPTRLRVLEFYEHRFRHKLFDEDVILAELSRSLKEEILINNVHLLLATVPFFSTASDAFISDVVTMLKFEVYMAGEYICRTGRKGDKMFFIQKGIVDILTKDNDLATSLGDGSHFGEICLLTTEARRVASVRAATTCDLYSLSSKLFHEVLGDYPEMKEMLEEVAKERLTRIGLQPDLRGEILKPSEREKPAFSCDPFSASSTSTEGTKTVETPTTKNKPKLPLLWRQRISFKTSAMLTQAFRVKPVVPDIGSPAQPRQGNVRADTVQVAITETPEPDGGSDEEDVKAMIIDF